MRLVVKYAGTTISTAADMRRAAGHLADLSSQHQLVAVCSASGTTTDMLEDVSRGIHAGDRRGTAELADSIIATHHEMAQEMAGGVSGGLPEGLGAASGEFRALVDGLLLLEEVTPRSLDHLLSFGERFSAILLAGALKGAGARAEPLTGKEAGILTDSRFGGARPLMDTTRLRVSKRLGGVMDGGVVPVVGGYSGADQHGRITTLGRGGSDYTATIIGTCVEADEIWLMGDAEGVMSADPHVVDGARVLAEVSYAEAIEMAMFGAKQIHPRTFEPVLDSEIPLRIRSAANTKHPGTLVVPAHTDPGRNTVKCVSALRGNGLIDIRGFGMVGSPGTAAGIFGTLAEAGIRVMMISQNPSESSITIVLKKADLHRAAHVLEMEHLGKTIKRLDVTVDVAMVALIGMGLRGTVGTASRVFTAVRNKDVNVIMITQGSSEINLAFVVRDSDAGTVIRALHDEFGLAG